MTHDPYDDEAWRADEESDWRSDPDWPYVCGPDMLAYMDAQAEMAELDYSLD